MTSLRTAVWRSPGFRNLRKTANAEALVGKNAMSGFLALMNSSETDINKLRGAIENCDGASESMARDHAGQFKWSAHHPEISAGGAGYFFGDILMPTIRKIVSAVQQFVDKLNSMDESTVWKRSSRSGFWRHPLVRCLLYWVRPYRPLAQRCGDSVSLAKGVRLLITHVGSASGVFSKLGVVLVVCPARS